MGLVLRSKPAHKAGIGGSSSGVSTKWVSALCIFSFCFGVFVVNRLSTQPNFSGIYEVGAPGGKYTSRDIYPVAECEEKKKSFNTGSMLSQVSRTHDVISTLDKTISSLEMQLVAARSAKAGIEGKSRDANLRDDKSNSSPKLIFVMGIITAFSTRKRRDSIRETWMPQGEQLKTLEKDKGIVIRFVIGRSGTPGGVLDRAIDAEDAQYKDFMRLNHVEGYHELPLKTQIYFSTAIAIWDASFYIKVDDDVHVNIDTLSSLFGHHMLKPRVYIGCMKSGPVIVQKGVKYREQEYWKFGEEGNRYFRHAAGQIYAISKDLATYISMNRHILHRYANEDVSLGSWFIGLDVEHIDERRLCCGTPPDCEWKAQAGNSCAASFDWSCSGICKSVERMKVVHQLCGTNTTS